MPSHRHVRSTRPFLILYDRLVKRYLNGLETDLPIGEVLAEQ
jgi:hypothetical protein